MLEAVKFANVSVVEPLPPGEGMFMLAEPVVSVGVAAAIVIAKSAVAETGVLSESVACTVKVVFPLAVGVPEMTPVDAFSCNPAGKLLPDASDQV